MSILDTSEYGGGLREGLKLFPGKFSEVRSQLQKQYKRAARLWLVNVNGDGFSDGKTKALLDLRGIVYFVDKPETGWNIHEEYRHNGRRLRPILNRLEEGIWSCSAWVVITALWRGAQFLSSRRPSPVQICFYFQWLVWLARFLIEEHRKCT
ncbi:MAG: hypothetical protein HY788_08625 [Deltaproteobacteria bacterium]|nr:hypothetical protein [Deltaproteobacteria bacterium]